MDKSKKLPKGSRLSLVQTQGLNPGDYSLYDLRGLTAGKVQLLVDLLSQVASDNPLAEDILHAIPTFKLFG